MCEPGTDRGGQTKAHRPCPAGGDPAIRLVEEIILRRPHLMLAHIGGHDCTTACRFPNIATKCATYNLPSSGQFMMRTRIAFRFPIGDLRQPFFVFVFIHQRHQIGQDGLQITDQRHIRLHILMDFGRVDFNMDFLRSGA